MNLTYLAKFFSIFICWEKFSQKILKTSKDSNNLSQKSEIPFKCWPQLWKFWHLIQITITSADQYSSHPAEINITSNLQSIETIRVRGWSKYTQYCNTWTLMWGSSIKSFVKNFFCLSTYWPKYIWKKIFWTTDVFKNFFFLFPFLFWQINKQKADAQKNV